ncbi:hypothetical protein TB2_018341 [Malus domestica]
MYGPKWLDILNQYSTQGNAQHKAILGKRYHMLRDYSAGGNACCEAARLDALLAARRLLGWRRCLLRGGSARGYARYEAARLMVFLIASIYFMSTCTQYELILNMTRVRLSGSHIRSVSDPWIGSASRFFESGPYVGSSSWGYL